MFFVIVSILNCSQSELLGIRKRQKLSALINAFYREDPAACKQNTREDSESENGERARRFDQGFAPSITMSGQKDEGVNALARVLVG